MALIKCTECGNEISDMATACPKCGKPTGIEEKKKSPSAAAVLNFIFWFPGYFYVGEYLLGVTFLLIFIEGAYTMLRPNIGAGQPELGMIIGLLMSILLAIDGYKRVQKYNQAQLKK